MINDHIERAIRFEKVDLLQDKERPLLMDKIWIRTDLDR